MSCQGILLKIQILGVPGWLCQLSIWLRLRSDLTIHEFKPCIGLCADSSEPGAHFGFCVSLSLWLSPTHTLSLSKINKTLKKLKKKKVQILTQQISARAWGSAFLISASQGLGQWFVDRFLSRKGIHGQGTWWGLCQFKFWFLTQCCSTLTHKERHFTTELRLCVNPWFFTGKPNSDYLSSKITQARENHLSSILFPTKTN